jgi:hypothetical protein
MGETEASRRRALEQAYRATTYRVDVPGQPFIAIRVGEHDDALDALLAARGVGSWTYITAYNPGSVPLSDAENERRHHELLADVARCGAVAVFDGLGVGDDGWPPEPSLLVLGVGRDEACSLGRKHGQVAVVYGERGKPAELVWCN